MNITIFDLKPVITRNGETFKDLSYPSIRYNFDPQIVGIVPMNEQMEMRPDLVSRSGFGNEGLWDIILKYNGYSNPFSISKDDIFLIPSLTDMQEQLAPSGEQDITAETVRKQYIDVSKKSKTDPKLIKAENDRKDLIKQKADDIGGIPSINNLPPNIAEAGDREIIIKGGKIYFGPDISKGKQECETPLTKSEFISKLIKKRLRNG